MSLTAGSRFGVYDIVGTIGAGGMGEVHRARDTKLNRDVAIKVLPPLFASDPERLARFEREAQTLAALNHPNIARDDRRAGREAGADHELPRRDQEQDQKALTGTRSSQLPTPNSHLKPAPTPARRRGAPAAHRCRRGRAAGAGAPRTPRRRLGWRSPAQATAARRSAALAARQRVVDHRHRLLAAAAVGDDRKEAVAGEREVIAPCDARGCERRRRRADLK